MVPQLLDKDETNFPWKQIFATLDVFVGAHAAACRGACFWRNEVTTGASNIPLTGKNCSYSECNNEVVILRQNYNDNGKSVSTAGAEATSTTTTRSAKDQTGDTASIGS